MLELTVSIFQPAAREDPPSAKLHWLDMAADRASKEGARLLVCPELYLSGYLAGEQLKARAQTRDGDYIKRVGEIALLHDIAIAYTYPELEGDRLYNAAGVVSPEGTLIAHYRKRVLPGSYEPKYFSADNKSCVFNYAGWKIGILICYDVEFPEAARQAALEGAELLIVPTALADRWTFVADSLVLTRAWENGVFLAYANFAGKEKDVTYLGGSRIVGPDGITDALAGQREEVLTATIDKARVSAARELLNYLKDRKSFEQ